MKKLRKFDPIDRDIVRVLRNARLSVTPTRIAESIHIHPATAKKRIEKLEKANIVNCQQVGNRKKCLLNRKVAEKFDYF